MRSRNAPRNLGLAAAAIVVGLAASTLRARGEPPAGPADGAPSGLVAFMAVSACPPGWIPATETQGRLIVGAQAPSVIGSAVGSALADQEDRTHANAGVGSVVLASRSIAGAGGGNDDGARSQTYTPPVEVKRETSKLPFIQLTACRRP